MLQITAIGLISVGIVYVLLLGEIDLSVGAGQRPRGGGDGRAERQARLEPVPGDRRRGRRRRRDRRRSRAPCSRRFVVPSFVVTLAGLLAWQGALLQVLGKTGSINLTDPKITGLANTFYSNTVGWIIAIVVIVAYGAVLALGHRRRVAAGLDGESPAGADRPLRAGRRGRDRRRRDPQLRPRRAAGGADPARLRDRDGVRGQADRLRPPRLRGRRQRRGGASGRHPRQRGADRGLRDRRHDGGDRRHHGRLAAASPSTRTPAATNSCCWRSPAR